MQRRFSKATQYAARQVADETSLAMYSKRTTDKLKSAFLVAAADFLRAPIVEEIITRDYKGGAGDVIKVKAYDDFKVTNLKVYIKGSDGKDLENGEATQDLAGDWIYKATVANPSMSGSTIQAVAIDRPGNEGTREVTV